MSPSCTTIRVVGRRCARQADDGPVSCTDEAKKRAAVAQAGKRHTRRLTLGDCTPNSDDRWVYGTVPPSRQARSARAVRSHVTVRSCGGILQSDTTEQARTAGGCPILRLCRPGERLPEELRGPAARRGSVPVGPGLPGRAVGHGPGVADYAVQLGRLGRYHRELAAPVAPAPDDLAFPETGQAVAAPFAAYWATHAGLITLGYPLTPLLPPGPDADTPVQWFERGRLEWHPDAAAPDDVAVTRLGAWLLAEREDRAAPGPLRAGRAGLHASGRIPVPHGLVGRPSR